MPTHPPSASGAPPPRVLAVASGGGHWIQLMRLRPALGAHRTVYASVDPAAAADVAPAPFRTIPDANRDTKLRLLLLTLRLAAIVIATRPQVVVTTGAAPGYVAIRLARLIGARTMFIDSVANARELSLSARLAEAHADRLLTQWPEVAARTGADYSGSVF